jgi:hypothetical protein
MKFLILFWFILSVAHGAIIDVGGTGGGGGGAWGTITGNLSDQTDLQTSLNGKANTNGTSNRFVWYNASGVLEDHPIFALGASGSMNSNFPIAPDNNGAGQGHNYSNYLVRPLQNSPNESWNMNNHTIEIDPDSTGFDIGTNGQVGSFFNLYFKHLGTSDIGQYIYLNTGADVGNGTDAISVNGYSIVNGFGHFYDNVTITGPLQGYGFQPLVDDGAFINQSTQAFYDASNYDTASESHISFNASPNLVEIKNNHNYTGLGINANIDDFTGNAGYSGVSVTGNLGTFVTGGYNGVYVNSNITDVDNAYGIYVSMDNVTSPNKKAAYLDGDVEITGSLAFGGALSIGSLTAFGVLNPVVDGGGNPTTINSLVSSITVPANATTANADVIGLNTAALISVGANSAITFGPLGVFSSLALPTVIETHTGSTLPRVQGGVFALNFAGTSTGGTVDEAAAARFVLIPNGITTITESIGALIENPFGNPGTTNFGIKQLDAERNYFAGTVESVLGLQLKTSGAQPTCAVATRGMFWNIEGGAGVADVLQVCQKDAANVYGWVTK